MSFKSLLIFILIVAVIAGAVALGFRYWPHLEQLGARVSAPSTGGQCADCHRRESVAIVHQFEGSRHAESGVTCIDCHQPLEGQEQYDHRGLALARQVTALNCAQCHAAEYREYLRSRHAAPAWAAVTGPADFSEEQVQFAENLHPGTIRRDSKQLAALEGSPVMTAGCKACHDVGKPNSDGSIGSCTDCHTAHGDSLALARHPETCAQCHTGAGQFGADIYRESRHGLLFEVGEAAMSLDVPARDLGVKDMSTPTCATCHMSGLEDINATHDTTGRLSYFLFAVLSDKRPHHQQGQIAMKETCLTCHAQPLVDASYEGAVAVVEAANQKILAAQKLMDGLYKDGLLTPAPFDEPIEFAYFDLWHYHGHTAKHGAFMGGADSVRWHGNYELLLSTTELEGMAAALRANRARSHPQPAAPEGVASPSSSAVPVP